MKKIILIFIMFCAVFSVHSQVYLKGTTTKPISSSTSDVRLTDAGIDTLNLTMSGDYSKVMSIQARLVKDSGTIAGTARLYGSNYGTTSTWVAVGDTATWSNATVNHHVWLVSEPPYKFYRILASGGTTLEGKLSAIALGIKPR